MAVALVASSAGFAAAQIPAWAQRQMDQPWTPDRKIGLFGSYYLKPSEAFLQAERREKSPDGETSYRKVTITLGDFKVTADEAMIGELGQIHLGANARLILPDRSKD